MTSVGSAGGYYPWLSGSAYPPGPVSWPAGQSWPVNGDSQLNGQDLNEQLSLPVSFLAAPPYYYGGQTNQYAPWQAVPASTATPVWLDTDFADSWSMHSAAPDATQVIIPSDCDGVYLACGTLPFNAGSASQFESQIYWNGSEYSAGEQVAGTSAYAPQAMDLIPCRSADSLQLCAVAGVATTLYNTYTPTGPQPYTSSQFPMFRLRWVAALSGTSGLTPPNITAMFSNPVASSDFNSYITNSVNFLSYVPYCRVAQGTGTSVPTGANTLVTGLAATLDNYGSWNSSTSTWTCQVPGIYLLFGQVGFPNESAAYSANSILSVTSGGSTGAYVGGKVNCIAPVSSVKRRLRLNAGDTVQLKGYHSYGSSLTTTNGHATRLFTLWQSS